MHRRSLIVIGALILIGAACAHRTPPVSAASEPQTADSVTVYVTNHLVQVEVFAAAGPTHNYRMGYVDPGGTRRFVLHVGWLFGRGVEFVAGGIRSGYLNLSPGDIVDWEINEGPSKAAIRRR